MPAINMTSDSVPYNLVNITGSGNIVDFIRNVNNLTEQTFMLGMLLVGFVILFVSMRESGNRDALIASSFMTAILAIFFFMLQFISTAMLTIIIIVFGGIFVFMVLKQD